MKEKNKKKNKLLCDPEGAQKEEEEGSESSRRILCVRNLDGKMDIKKVDKLMEHVDNLSDAKTKYSGSKSYWWTIYENMFQSIITYYNIIITCRDTQDFWSGQLV